MGEAVGDERWQRVLPFGLLALAVVVGSVAAPELDGDGPGLAVQLALAAATAAWMALFALVLEPTPRRLVVHYVGRTALAFALTWINPFYAIFGFIGFTDAFDVLRRRGAILLAMFVTAVIQGGSQSGGLPPEGEIQTIVLGALVLLNFAAASALTYLHVRVERANEQQAATIGELERLNAELAEALADNRTLQATVVGQARAAGVQEERQRLAREIHDTLAQSLAGIVTQLQAAGRSRADPHLAAATEMARSALVEARRSVLDLGPAPLDGSALTDALAGVVEEWCARGTVKADLVVTGEPHALHPEVEATVLRLAQEALTNVAKHAAATRVGVTISYLDDEVILDVRDDGVGFDTGTAPQAGSFGLRSMRQRAERLAGVLEVESEPGQGATVSARLPAVERGAA